jgi:predicted dehydrogenase
MTKTNGRRNGSAVDAGVIGVGKMGANHARVYSELQNVNLVGVADADAEQAQSVADKYGAEVMDRADLLSAVDIVSIAVPTELHYEFGVEAVESGVDLLIEKPFVDDYDRGEELAERAEEAGVTLQVGHIERFNPAVRVVTDLAPELDIISVDVRRLGPPVDRGGSDSVVYDLMVHDLDLLLSLVDDDIDEITANGRDKRHVSAQLTFDDGAIGDLTASRLTQQKVRTLGITAMDCQVNVDFIDQSVEIHRQSFPEFIEQNGDVRYRQESVIERPMVKNGEPLKAELRSFVESAVNGTEPVVTAEDGLRVLKIAERVENEALAESPEVSP